MQPGETTRPFDHHVAWSYMAPPVGGSWRKYNYLLLDDNRYLRIEKDHNFTATCVLGFCLGNPDKHLEKSRSE